MRVTLISLLFEIIAQLGGPRNGNVIFIFNGDGIGWLGLACFFAIWAVLTAVIVKLLLRKRK